MTAVLRIEDLTVGQERQFRHYLGDTSFVTAEDFGALGQDTAPVDFTDPVNPVVIGTPVGQTTNRAAIQAAVDYANANDIPRMHFLKKYYAVRRRAYDQVGYPGSNFLDWTMVKNGRGKSITLEGITEGTQIVRLDSDGTAMNAASYEDAGGYNCRGGGLGVEGMPSGTDPFIGCVTLRNVIFDGGLRRAMGTIFEFLDKGLWVENDTDSGHITFEGKSGFIGFTSEVTYFAGTTGAEMAKRNVTFVGGECVFAETGGSCINPNGQTLIGAPRCYNAFIGIEGWIGSNRGRFDPTFEDCTQSTIQGGHVNQDAGIGGYYAFTGEPGGVLGGTYVRSPLTVGCCIYGRVQMVDCTLLVSDGAAFAEGSRANTLDVDSVVDASSLSSAVFLGGANALDNFIKVNCRRTKAAATAGRKHSYVVSGYGTYGGGNTIEVGSFYEAMSAVWNAASTCAGPAIKFAGHLMPASGYDPSTDIETLSGGTFSFVGTGPNINLSCSGSPAARSFSVNLPNTNVEVGLRRTINNYTNNSVGGGVALRIPAANFRGRVHDVIFPAGYGGATVEYEGAGYWRMVSLPPPLSFSAVVDPASIADQAKGTAMISNVYGARQGDPVQVAASISTGGMTLTARCEANDTILVTLDNQTGGAVDLGSLTLTGTVGVR